MWLSIMHLVLKTYSKFCYENYKQSCPLPCNTTINKDSLQLKIFAVILEANCEELQNDLMIMSTLDDKIMQEFNMMIGKIMQPEGKPKTTKKYTMLVQTIHYYRGKSLWTLQVIQ